MAIKKLCPGCGKLIEYNMHRCVDCEEKYTKRQEEHNRKRYKQYKSNRTDKKEQKFYISIPWKRMRELIKSRDKGLCRLCLSKDDIQYMNTVHHIKELKDCWDDRMNPNNLISLCESCHQQVHKEYLKGNLEKKEIQNKLMELIRVG